MVDPLGLVYEGKAGTGAAAGTPESPITGMLAEQIKQKRKEEKLKKSAAVGAFKPLGTPWDRDEVDIATKREELGKMAGKYMETNPKFIYQPQSPEYQGFMGAYNELKEDIAFSKQHAAVYKDLMDKAQSSTGLKHFDFDKTTNEYLAWAELPLAERKLLPLPMPTLKEETFDPNAAAEEVMANFEPQKFDTIKETSYGRVSQEVLGHTPAQMKSASRMFTYKPENKKWLQDTFLEPATDEQKADWERGRIEMGYDTVEEYLAYVEVLKDMKHYKEDKKPQNMTAWMAKQQDEATFIRWELNQLHRMIAGDADLWTQSVNAHGYQTIKGSQWYNIPLGRYISVDEETGKKTERNILTTRLSRDPITGKVMLTTNQSEERAEKSKKWKDQYETLYHKGKGVFIDNMFAKFLAPLLRSGKGITTEQAVRQITKEGYWLNEAENQLNWDAFYSTDIETQEQKKERAKIIGKRNNLKKKIIRGAESLEKYSYGFWGEESEIDASTVADMNELFQDINITVADEKGDVKTYKSPILKWTGLGILGKDLKLIDSETGDVIKTIKNQEDIEELLERAVHKNEK